MHVAENMNRHTGEGGTRGGGGAGVLISDIISHYSYKVAAAAGTHWKRLNMFTKMAVFFVASDEC